MNPRVEALVEEAQKWSDSQIQRSIDKYVFSTDAERSLYDDDVLRALAPKVVPHLLRLLGDPNNRVKLGQSDQDGWGTPIQRVCRLLERDPPAQAAPLIASFLKHASKNVRQQVAIVLGTIADAYTVHPLRQAFNDSDEYVRSYALIGLQRAIDAERLSEECRRELFADLQQLTRAGNNTDQAPWLLLLFDEPRALEFFLTPEIFDPVNRFFHDVLRAVVVRGSVVPRDRLQWAIATLESAELVYPNTYALGAALNLLGRHQMAEDREAFVAYMSHDDERVAEGAAAGLLASHGLDNWRDRIAQIEAARGETSLSKLRGRIDAVFSLHGEVENGGFSQYFFNSSGNNWRDALSGLHEIGATGHAGVLQDAAVVFGENGPPEDRYARVMELSSLKEGRKSAFKPLDTRYYDCKDNLEVLATRCLIRHADEFQLDASTGAAR